MSTRQADFAGSWYPETQEECLRMFERFDADCATPEDDGALQAGIVPHAGWIYSGKIAYNVVRELARSRPAAETVLLFGGHLGPAAPISIMSGGGFWTPLGEIPTDEELAAAILEAAPTVSREAPERHTPDNTVELQAPFIKHLLPDARIVVISAPPRTETLGLVEEIHEICGRLGRGDVLALGSTDLTHYGPSYGWSPKGHGAAAERWVREENDPRFIELVCKLEAQEAIAEALERSNACCPGAAAAAVQWARLRGATAGWTLSYATSADVRRDTSFVGYAGILL